MRYFIRRLVEGGVDTMPIMNGPYGYCTREDAEEDLREFLGEYETAFFYKLVGEVYDSRDFFIESEAIELPYNAPD